MVPGWCRTPHASLSFGLPESRVSLWLWDVINKSLTGDLGKVFCAAGKLQLGGSRCPQLCDNHGANPRHKPRKIQLVQNDSMPTRALQVKSQMAEKPGHAEIEYTDAPRQLERAARAAECTVCTHARPISARAADTPTGTLTSQRLRRDPGERGQSEHQQISDVPNSPGFGAQQAASRICQDGIAVHGWISGSAWRV